jgi:hypothetical protein
MAQISNAAATGMDGQIKVSMNNFLLSWYFTKFYSFWIGAYLFYDLTDIRQRWKGDLLYCQFSWILPQHSKQFLYTWNSSVTVKLLASFLFCIWNYGTSEKLRTRRFGLSDVCVCFFFIFHFTVYDYDLWGVWQTYLHKNLKWSTSTQLNQPWFKLRRGKYRLQWLSLKYVYY